MRIVKLKMERLTKFGKKQYKNISDRIYYRMLGGMKNLMVIGGGSDFGRKVVEPFQNTWRIVNIDTRINDLATENISLDFSYNSEKTLDTQILELNEHLTTYKKFDAIIYCHEFENIR